MVEFSSRDSFYKTPFGAVKEGEEVRLRITTPPNLYIFQAEFVINDGVCDQSFPMVYETTTSDYNSFTVSYTPDR